jgi:hypothetical protein
MPALDRAARLEAFITAATVKHNGQYDYSHVATQFVNAHTKVAIDCPDHGEFEQTPNEHRRGQRCPDCSGRRNSRPQARREQFIARARRLHGDHYDYDLVVYVDQRTPVIITCRAHGPFTQRPMNHLSSHTPSNCLDCAKHNRRRGFVTAWQTRQAPRRNTETGVFEKAA